VVQLQFAVVILAWALIVLWFLPHRGLLRAREPWLWSLLIASCASVSVVRSPDALASSVRLLLLVALVLVAVAVTGLVRRGAATPSVWLLVIVGCAVPFVLHALVTMLGLEQAVYADIGVYWNVRHVGS